MAEAGQRILDDRDTYFPHLNGIPLGLEHMRWALTAISAGDWPASRYPRRLDITAKAKNPLLRRRTRNASAGC